MLSVQQWFCISLLSSLETYLWSGTWLRVDVQCTFTMLHPHLQAAVFFSIVEPPIKDTLYIIGQDTNTSV